MLERINREGKLFQVHLALLRIRIMTIHAVGIKQIEMLFWHDGLGFCTEKSVDGQSKPGQKERSLFTHA